MLYLHPLRQKMLQRTQDRVIGELAEWSNAAVLKTVEGHTSRGSNPLLSAKGNPQRKLWVFCFTKMPKLFQLEGFFGKQKTKTRFFSVAQGFYACTG